jgi:radical SAM protein with 4Fe4S-binding SPASM domain
MTIHRQFQGHDVYVSIGSPRPDRALLYAPTLQRLVDVSAAAADRATGLQKGHFEEALREYIPRAHEELQSACKSAVAVGVVDHEQRKQLVVFPLSVGLSRRCTLACSYCHVDARSVGEVTSRAVLEAAVRHAEEQVRKHAMKSLHVSFSVGGEPTYEWETFLWFVEMCNHAARKLGVTAYKAITTNGFYDEKVRSFLCKEFDHILLSIDGPQAIQDAHRPTAAGKSSFAVVVDSGRTFAREAKRFAVRATVSDFSAPSLNEVVEFFVASFGKATEIVLEPMVEIGRASARAGSDPAPPGQLQFARAFWSAYRTGMTLGVKVASSCFNATRIVRTFCKSVSMPSFVVTSSGNVTICARDAGGKDYGYARYEPESGRFRVDEVRLGQLAAMTQLPGKCSDCICLWHCAGDCPDTRLVGIDRCEANRLLLSWHLRYLVGGKEGT